jgi:hypothetical protein
MNGEQGNRPESTRRGASRRIAFACGAFLLAAAVVGYFTNHPSSQDARKQDGHSSADSTIAVVQASSIVSSTSVPAGWKTCQSAKLGFSVKYPADWIIVIPSRGMASSTGKPATNPTVASCDDPRVKNEIYLGPKTPAKGSSEFDIDVCDLACMNESIYHGVKTLDEYLSRKPVELYDGDNPVIKTGTLDGEKSVTLKDGSMLVFHRGQKYVFIGNSASVLATFQFIDR